MNVLLIKKLDTSFAGGKSFIRNVILVFLLSQRAGEVGDVGGVAAAATERAAGAHLSFHGV